MGGCGGSSGSTLRLPADYLPLPAGRTAAYRLPPTSAAVAHRAPIAGLRCRRGLAQRRFGIHLELYADRLVVPVPAGVGVAPPLRRRGAYVTGGACSYPIRTREPTGVFELARGGLRLGTLFAVWGQPLAPGRLARFSGPVAAYVSGRRWRGDPQLIPLGPHAEIVLETGGYVPPHPRYLFAHGL
jgi:hypothetical protein